MPRGITEKCILIQCKSPWALAMESFALNASTSHCVSEVPRCLDCTRVTAHIRVCVSSKDTRTPQGRERGKGLCGRVGPLEYAKSAWVTCGTIDFVSQPLVGVRWVTCTEQLVNESKMQSLHLQGIRHIAYPHSLHLEEWLSSSLWAGPTRIYVLMTSHDQPHVNRGLPKYLFVTVPLFEYGLR